jgi:WD40 repeat protein
MSDAPLTHPTDEELRGLSLGRLGEVELARVYSHLGDCPECCRRIDQLAAADPLLARLQQSAEHHNEALVGQAHRRSAVRALRRGQAARAVDRSGDAGTEPVILSAPSQVGDYEILAEVGRGGMGVVYKARHRSLHRLAAVKMVLAGEFASHAQELRFRLEAELAARVRHPNIVQVYEIGSYHGRPFLALEWVEAGSLAARLDGRPWPPREAGALIETLARAIHVAHAQGVIHRDLKPANILLQVGEGGKTNDQGESSRSGFTPLPASGVVPKITDFGLARPTEGGTTLTHSGFLLGTPGYMAPEQASGGRALVGPATDIYALGVILYQLLTGQLPFQGDSTLEVLRAVTSDEPVRPRRLQPRVPRDLEAITLHCLEKEPTRRYPSALALAEDLERFRDAKQVTARPVGVAARLARACRRRPLVAILLALLTASLFGGLAGVTWKWLEADEQRDLANSRALRLAAERHEAMFQTYRARLAAAVAALAAHDVADAARQLDAAPGDLRDWEWRHLRSRLDDSSSVIPLPAGADSFLLPATDRVRVATFTGIDLRLLDLESGERTTLPIGPERGQVCGIADTRRGLRIAAWVGNTTLILLDQTGQIICRMQTPDFHGPGPVVISPDGTRLACPAYFRESLRFGVFDAASGKQTALCDRHQDDIWTMTVSPDGTRLVSAGEGCTAHVWEMSTGLLLPKCAGHDSKVLSARFRPDGARLVTASSDGTVRQWDPLTGREVEPPYDRHTGDVAVAVYSPDGQWVASAGTDRVVRVWRATGRQDVAILHGHTGPVVSLAFAQGGRRLASVSSRSRLVPTGDDTARIWDLDTRDTLPALHGHSSYVYPVAFSPDGRWIASGGWDNWVRLWDAATGEQCAKLPHSGFVRCLAYAPDGRWLVSGSDGESRMRIWDVATARIRKEIPVPAWYFRSLAVSPDGTRVAATAIDPQSSARHLYICDPSSGERLFSAPGHALAYSPDGRWLAVVTADLKTVLLLDAATHETSARFPAHDQEVHAGVFSPDSRLLATCGLDRTVRVWHLDGGTCQLLSGHTGDVFAVAFHPDGTRLASAGRDQAVWLWDLARGEEVARLQGHTSYVWSLAFSPDGATLASGSGDRTVRLWDTAPLKTRYNARREADALRPEAERIVAKIWSASKDPIRVAEALRADSALNEPLRHAALRALLWKVMPPEAHPSHNP